MKRYLINASLYLALWASVVVFVCYQPLPMTYAQSSEPALKPGKLLSNPNGVIICDCTQTTAKECNCLINTDVE